MIVVGGSGESTCVVTYQLFEWNKKIDSAQFNTRPTNKLRYTITLRLASCLIY